MEENYKNKFYAIIGKKPSEGARSPRLWNACFKKFGMKIEMIPIDIKKEKFDNIFNKLIKNRNYLGGAVAAPYKQKVFNKLKFCLDNKTKLSLAINCIIKKKKIRAFNTDGEAALIVLKKNNLNKNHKILLMGLGGAGKAIATQLFKFSKNNLTVTGRSQKALSYAKKNTMTYLNWNNIHKKLNNFDYIVNCTSVGFNNEETPIKKKYLINIKNKVFFDIIYTPEKTKLLSIVERNNKIINGREMNLFQAVLAFSKISRRYKFNKILNIMKKVK
jgi:shikimate dehydrogenase